MKGNKYHKKIFVKVDKSNEHEIFLGKMKYPFLYGTNIFSPFYQMTSKKEFLSVLQVNELFSMELQEILKLSS